MNYEEKTITIKDTKTGTGAREITAHVGVGTGLACTEITPNMWSVTHVSSGFALPYTLPTMDEAKRYLEMSSNIFRDQWNCDLVTVKKRMYRHANEINARIRAAYEASLNGPGDEYFLYARSEDDIFTESNTDAADTNPNSEENQCIASELLKDYPEADKVIMTRMDPMGKHHNLKTFLRNSVAVGA